MPDMESITPSKALDYRFNYVRNAFRRTDVKSLQQQQVQRSQDLKLTSEKVGRLSRKINLKNYPRNGLSRLINLVT